MTRDVKDPTGLSQLFHMNSEPWVDESYGPPPPFLQRAKSFAVAPRITLPETKPSAVDELARSRRSTRAFMDEALSLETLGALLRSGYAAVGPTQLDHDQTMLRRPVPSAGGLYPLEIYALVRNVDGVAPGVYHYDSIGDALEAVDIGPWEDMAAEAFLTWQFVAQAPVVLCISAVFERCQAKYGPRGYRYVLLEAGHVGQNLALRAAEDGLSTLFLGGFNDAILNKLIGLDGIEDAVVYTMAAGLGP